jgi:uncharacterized protein (DUF924 family)
VKSYHWIHRANQEKLQTGTQGMAMSWTYEWAARWNTLGSREALVQLASLAGHGMWRSDERSEDTDAADPLSAANPPSNAAEVVAFWRAAGPQLWFAKDDAFDRRFRDRFLHLHEAASRGTLHDWWDSPLGTLGLLILLDQYPRNAFRGSPRMYATDARARHVAAAAVAAGHDRAFEPDLQLFFYLPFGHSEDLNDQERSVALTERLGEPNISHAKRHCGIVRRFGRFPHRNPILGRAMTADEQRFLDAGGYAG